MRPPQPYSHSHGSAMTETTPQWRPPLVLNVINYAVGTAFLVYMVYYYWTGLGGSTLLAMTMVPITYVLFTVQALRQNELYPKLPMAANYLIAAVYCLFSLYCAYYMNTNYIALGTERSGMWDTADEVVGGGMALLIIEYARKRHVPLFILNIVLALYAVYGYMVPGMFYHAGLSWHRVITASSVEMTTGIFSRLPQIALTLIGSFLLVLSLLRGYGCVDSLLRATKRVAIRSAHAIPQSAVIGSMAIGTVSGSGAANSITVGSATIPAMIGAGLPPATAAAIENASSMGGQLMPPVMGIAAFLMAEFLGVDYFEVVARGWVPALIYYITVATSVYLLAVHYRTHLVVDPKPGGLGWRDKVNLGAFVFVVGGLVTLMATIFLAPMFAALYMFCIAGVGLFLVNLVPLLRPGRWSFAEFIAPIQRFLDSYIEMISDITLLLGDLVDHDRGAGDYRRSHKARRAAGGGRRHQYGRHGRDGLHLRRHSRHRSAPGADLYSGRDRDRAALHQDRRQSVGDSLLRLFRGRVRRADAADLDHRGDHVEDRQCIILCHALAFGADLRLAVHADGRRLRPSRAGHRAGHRSVWRGLSYPGLDHRHHF